MIADPVDAAAGVGTSAPPHAPRLTLHGLPWPTDWAALFGRQAPLFVEIGFGRGDALLDLARRHPEANVVGVEMSNRCLSAVERDAARRGLAHVKVVHATGQSALAHLFAPASIDRLVVLFPDPWFKARHAHRRLLGEATVALIASRLAPGAVLEAATDVADYAAAIDAVLSAQPALRNAAPGGVPWLAERRSGAVTKYERLGLAAGRRCAYFHYERGPLAAPDRPVIAESAMPHVALRTAAVTPAAVAAAFRPRRLAVADRHIHLQAVYAGASGLLVDTVVVEPTIAQHVAIGVHARADGAWVVSLATIGQPRATLGCHLAVALVGRWLLEAAPDAAVAAGAVSLDPAARTVLDRPLTTAGPTQA
mgnify:CR=1 FL=1